MSDANSAISFEWKNVLYSIPEARKFIILPNFEMLIVDGPINQSQPENLRRLLTIEVTPLFISLEQIAREMDAALATAVDIVNTKICPKGCSKPTYPFCSQCGSPTKIVKTLVPYVIHKFSLSINTPVMVEDGKPCPRCKQTIRGTYSDRCPKCGQKISFDNP